MHLNPGARTCGGYARTSSGTFDGTLRARIRVTRDFLRILLPLLDNEVGREPADNGLDLRQFVPRNDSEVGGLGANRLVLDHRHRNRFRTVGAPALAGEVDHLGVRLDLDVMGRDLGHTLIHLSEERLIPGESFVSSAHQAIVSNLLIHESSLRRPTTRKCEAWGFPTRHGG